MGVVLAGVLVFAVSACGGDQAATTTTAPDSSETTVLLPPRDPSPSSSVPPGEGSGVPSAYLDAVTADAAQRAGVAASEVALVEARSVEWPDGSLGCPEPGMLYTQVITPGYQVVVTAGGEQFDYRVNRRGGFRLCDPSVVPDVRDPDASIPGTTSADS